MNYNEQLKDPRWKSKAKQIKERDNYICQKCGTHQKLEVHHIRYLKDTLYWDYPDSYLITLCRSCHQEETDDLKKLDNKINSMLTSGLFAKEVMQKLNVSFHPRLDSENEGCLNSF
jgi:hypothetical protein